MSFMMSKPEQSPNRPPLRLSRWLPRPLDTTLRAERRAKRNSTATPGLFWNLNGSNIGFGRFKILPKAVPKATLKRNRFRNLFYNVSLPNWRFPPNLKSCETEQELFEIRRRARAILNVIEYAWQVDFGSQNTSKFASKSVAKRFQMALNENDP